MINSKRWWFSPHFEKVNDGGVVFWFASVVNKSIFIFSNLISTENENNDKVVGKWTGVHGFVYALSHKRYGRNKII
jgi:hypothetical protein